MSFFNELLGEGSERSIFIRSSAIIKHARKANDNLVKIINGDYKVCGNVKSITHDSDNEVFNLSNSITSGGVAPNLIDDFMRFVNTEDEIVDMIFTLSRALCRYEIKDRKAADFVKKRLLNTTDIIDQSLQILLKMHTTDTADAMRKLRSRVEELEQRDDEIKESLLDFAYDSKLDYKTFYQITTVAYLSDDIVDSCEDSADMLLSIMLSILT